MNGFFSGDHVIIRIKFGDNITYFERYFNFNVLNDQIFVLSNKSSYFEAVKLNYHNFSELIYLNDEILGIKITNNISILI
jgi:hypothetical protein